MNGLMVLRVSLKALYRNKTRSFLTALGIIMGIAAVIVVVAMGQGATVMVKTQISNMGSNLVMVFPGSQKAGGFRGGMGTQQTLTADDGAAILKECSQVEAMSPMVMSGGQVIYHENNWRTMIQGVSVSYPNVRNWPIESGDFFTDSDIKSGNRVCLVGKTVVTQIFADEDPVGKTIRIRNMPFRVIGVLSGKGSTAWGQDQDDTILAPWTTVRRVLQNSPFNNVNQILISLKSMDSLSQARAEIVGILRQRHKLGQGTDDDFTVLDMVEITQTMTQVSSVMSMLLTVTAAISLIVGGIGIMNIMLVAVTERTREIGLRMAVGARRRDILLQFLAEAVTLSCVGGILGIALGIGFAKIVVWKTHWPLLISPVAVFVALLFSASVGIFFGFYPASRASRLNPIESLHHE
jgi:putative ABC transport system permease protein